MNHPATERLQEFAEEVLGGPEHAVVDAHLAACARCRAEVEELRSLFLALSSLPAFEPTAGFADRVMKHVRVRQPVLAAAAAWIERVTPRSTRGWATAAAVFGLPVIGATVLVGWLLAQPGVDAQGLWTLTTGLAGDAAVNVWQWTWTQLAGSTLAAWMVQVADLLDSVGRGEIGLAVVMFSTLTAGSIYILYQNLFRTQQQRRIEHASYVI
jgi:anti-sigma factor RsiW